MAQQRSMKITILTANGRCQLICDPTCTAKELKEMYIYKEIGHGSVNDLSFNFRGKPLRDNITLEEYDIDSFSPIVVSIRVRGGGIFEEHHDDWKIMYERCPVCAHNRKDKLPKGYWYHPGSNQAEFRSAKPGTYAVETKSDKIRCSGCKNECNGKDWVYKCANHDYQKINY
eukprot:UN07792